MKIIGGLLVGTVLIFSACNNRNSAVDDMKATVSKINKTCPTMVDSETQLDGVELNDNNTLKYKYTLINIFVANVDTHEFYLQLWPGLLSTIKISKDMQQLRENKTTVEYYYADKEHKPIYSFRITPKDYEEK